MEQAGPIISLVRELGPAAASVTVVLFFLYFLRWYVQQQQGALGQLRETCNQLTADQRAARDAFAAEMRQIIAEMRGPKKP